MPIKSYLESALYLTEILAPGKNLNSSNFNRLFLQWGIWYFNTNLLPMVPGRLMAAGPGEVNSAEMGPLLLWGVYTKFWLDLPMLNSKICNTKIIVLKSLAYWYSKFDTSNVIKRTLLFIELFCWHDKNRIINTCCCLYEVQHPTVRGGC